MIIFSEASDIIFLEARGPSAAFWAPHIIGLILGTTLGLQNSHIRNSQDAAG